jgi:hypothetical protein
VKALVAGVAGFIFSHLVESLIECVFLVANVMWIILNLKHPLAIGPRLFEGGVCDLLFEKGSFVG